MRIFSLTDYSEDSKNHIYNFIFKFISYVVETWKPINQFSAIIQMLTFKTCKNCSNNTLLRSDSQEEAVINMCLFENVRIYIYISSKYLCDSQIMGSKREWRSKWRWLSFSHVDRESVLWLCNLTMTAEGTSQGEWLATCREGRWSLPLPAGPRQHMGCLPRALGTGAWVRHKRAPNRNWRLNDTLGLVKGIGFRAPKERKLPQSTVSARLFFSWSIPNYGLLPPDNLSYVFLKHSHWLRFS